MIGIGTHEVAVKNTGLSKSQSGNVQIVVEFYDQADETLSAFLATTEAAWPYTEDKLRVLGWDPAQNGFRFEDLNSEPSPIAGNQVQIVVDAETFDGKTRNKVKFINPPGGKAIERMAPAEAQSFAAQLRKRLTGQTTAGVARPAAKKPLPKTPAEHDGPPLGDDDQMPF